MSSLQKFADPPEERMRRYIAYDLMTGAFTRISAYWDRHIGTRCDHRDPRGFMSVKFEERRYLGHRLAWWYMRNEWPLSEIIHVNDDITDNRIDNLVLADARQRIATRTNYGPLKKGVCFHKGTGKFQAQIRINGLRTYLGLFETEEAAHQAYLAELSKQYGKFARSA